MSLAADVQIGAHATADRDRRALSDVCDVEIQFTGPASVVALLRDVLDAFARPGAPRWSALERLLEHVGDYWNAALRYRDPIFARRVALHGARVQLAAELARSPHPVSIARRQHA